MKPAIITNIFHSRAFALTVAALAFVAAGGWYALGLSDPLPGDKGLVLPSANQWLGGATAPSYAAATAGSIAVMVLMWLFCKIFNVMRSVTFLYIALFAMMQLATPDFFTTYYTGTVLAQVVPACLLLLFGSYRQLSATRHVFLAFLLLSFFMATQYCFGVYFVLLLTTIGQMRIFNGRSLTAAFLGALTPWWLLVGFGAVTAESFHAPEFHSIFAGIDTNETALLLSTVGLTALLTVLTFVLNVLKTIAYNARSRAMNGSMSLMAILTIVAMAADYTNLISYIPLLNVCAALQVSHYFSTHRADRSYLVITLILVAYAALFVCRTII